MIDVISLVVALTGLVVAVLSHIRHSECFGVKIETQPLLQNSPAIIEPTIPIDIPPRPKPKIKNWL